jgi:hypothetical protein
MLPPAADSKKLGALGRQKLKPKRHHYLRQALDSGIVSTVAFAKLMFAGRDT